MQGIKPQDAVRAKEVIDGLRLKETEHIEISSHNKERVIETLQSIGHT